jgi:hypothetical protein
MTDMFTITKLEFDLAAEPAGVSPEFLNAGFGTKPVKYRKNLI